MCMHGTWSCNKCWIRVLLINRRSRVHRLSSWLVVFTCWSTKSRERWSTCDDQYILSMNCTHEWLGWELPGHPSLCSVEHVVGRGGCCMHHSVFTDECHNHIHSWPMTLHPEQHQMEDVSLWLVSHLPLAILEHGCVLMPKCMAFHGQEDQSLLNPQQKPHTCSPGRTM